MDKSTSGRGKAGGCEHVVPGLDEAALDSSSEEQRLELLRLLLLLSGTDTLAEVVLVAVGGSTVS